MSKRTFVTDIGIFTVSEEDGFITEVAYGEGDGFLSDSPVLIQAEKELREYIAGERTEFSVPIVFHGTEFQKSVWNALINIPYGETRTYSDIAKIIGREKSTRAVGNACHNNGIIIIVPCHRVVAKSGIGGFGCGLDLKKKLFEIEHIEIPKS